MLFILTQNKYLGHTDLLENTTIKRKIPERIICRLKYKARNIFLGVCTMRQYIPFNGDNDFIYFQGAESAWAGTMESLPPPLTTGSTIRLSSLLGRFCSSLQFCRLNNSHDLLKWQHIGAPQPWVPSLSAESSVVITGNKTSALNRRSQEQHYGLMSIPKKL